MSGEASCARTAENEEPDANQAGFKRSPFSLGENGAGEQTRTADLLITNQLLYQLSYAGPGGMGIHGLR